MMTMMTMMTCREAVAEDLVRVAHRSVGHESAHTELLEAQELDVAPHRLPRADRRHHEDGARAALLEGLVLGRVHAERLVRGDVGTLRHEAKGHGTAARL